MSRSSPVAMRQFYGAIGVVAFLSLGCITMPWNDDGIERPDRSGLECGTFADEPMLGFIWDDVEPVGDGCEDIPIEPGFQGGFHITPVVWIPDGELPENGAGVSRVTVTFVDSSTPALVQENEVFDNFWQPEGGGRYVSSRVIIPNDMVDEGVRLSVELDYEIDFDHPDSTDIGIMRQMELYL